jgi:hypothetical protein
LLDQTARGKHEHGDLDTALAQLPANLHSTHARKSDIQQDGVIIDI